MTKRLGTGNICFACGEKRPRKELGYALDTLKTYCYGEDKYCPNRPKKLVKASIVPDVLEAIKEKYPNNFESMNRLIGEPIAIRLQPHQILYLMKLAQTKKFDNVSNVFSYILSEYEKKHSLDAIPLTENIFTPRQRKKKQIQKQEEEIRNYNELQEQEQEKQPEPEKDDEMEDFVL